MSKTKSEMKSFPHVAKELDPSDAPMNLSEVARVCGKSPQTIKRWILDGLLTAVRMPTGLYGVRRSELRKFLGASALQVNMKE